MATQQVQVMGKDGRKSWRWYHGALFYAGVQAASWALGKLVQRSGARNTPKAGELVLGNDAYDTFYNDQKQPVFAPPDWSFPLVWTVNNALCIWGLLHVLNLPKNTPGRTPFLALQGTVWACFTTFNALYFGLRSPVSGAVNTNIGLAGTLASVYVALFQLRDKRAALSQSTILPWLLLAAPTATAIAAWNKDDFLGTGPLTDPQPAWVKNRKQFVMTDQHE